MHSDAEIWHSLPVVQERVLLPEALFPECFHLVLLEQLVSSDELLDRATPFARNFGTSLILQWS